VSQTVIGAPSAPAPARPLRVFQLTLSALGAAVLGLAIGAVIVALVATRLFDFRVLTVSSGSMAPAIAAGDLVGVRPVSIDKVHEGEVVLFTTGRDEVPTLHRVIGINEIELQLVDRATQEVEVLSQFRLVTKGDANPVADTGEVTADDLRGRVWFAIPNVGALGGAGLLIVSGLLLAIAALAWAIWEVSLRVRDSRRPGGAKACGRISPCAAPRLWFTPARCSLSSRLGRFCSGRSRSR